MPWDLCQKKYGGKRGSMSLTKEVFIFIFKDKELRGDGFVKRRFSLPWREGLKERELITFRN